MVCTESVLVYFAAQAGKYWNARGGGCELYWRCDTPVDEILAMIENELYDFESVEQSMFGNKIKFEKDMREMKNWSKQQWSDLSWRK